MQVTENQRLRGPMPRRRAERVKCLSMLDEPVSEGDVVSTHPRYAVRKFAAEEALATWELLDEMLAAERSHA